MTREEEIKKVAGTYAIKKVAGTYAKDTCNPASKRGLLYDGFVDGAQWADQHPHWISVEDELPEVCVAVLTTTPHGTQRAGFYEDGWWLANTTDLVRMGSITHWIPLPQAPKGGEI